MRYYEQSPPTAGVAEYLIYTMSNGADAQLAVVSPVPFPMRRQ